MGLCFLLLYEIYKVKCGVFIMRKSIIVSLFVLVIFLFLGCNLSNRLVGTKWEVKTSTNIETVYIGTLISFEFTDSENFIMSTSVIVGEDVKTESFPGKWYIEDNCLNTEMNGAKEVYLIKIKGRTLNMALNDENKTPFLSLTRVK